MTTPDQLLEHVVARQDLDAAGALAVARALAAVEVPHKWKREVLLGLAQKGESPLEVASFAQAFRDLALDPELGDQAADSIDVVGTGGDKSGSYNISTTVCFILAAAGIRVLKHGNRSITSKCGSADLLEAVGIPTEAPPEVLRESFRELGFAFFFAPAWHPAFKEIMPVRKALAAEGHRTIFNILGPLINPGRPGRQLLGVFSSEWVRPLAESLEQLGVRRGLVVHGMVGDRGVMDELTCAGINRVAGIGELGEIDHTWAPDDFGLAPCEPIDLKGGDVNRNKELLNDLLTGRAPAGLRDTVAWNAGAAMWIADRARSIEEGIATALRMLEDGCVERWLERTARFYRERGLR